MTTQRTSSDDGEAIDATTDAAVAAGGWADPGPMHDYRVSNRLQEA